MAYVVISQAKQQYRSASNSVTTFTYLRGVNLAGLESLESHCCQRVLSDRQEQGYKVQVLLP